MATAEQIYERQNEAVDKLEQATDDVLELVDLVKSTPRLAQEAKTAAETAVANSTEAVNTANAAMPKTGGYFTGNIGITNNMPQINFDGLSLEQGVMPTQTKTFGNTFRDKDHNLLGQICYQGVSDFAQQVMWLYPLHETNNANTAIIGVRAYASGEIIGMSPPPRENVNENDIDTKRASVARHPLKQTEQKVIHIGGTNASDTANLNAGRGLSASMPFASLTAAFNWAFASYQSTHFPLVFQIHQNWTLNEIGINAPAGMGMIIQGSSGVTLTLGGPIKLLSGTLTLQGINIAGNGIENFFSCGMGFAGPATLVLGNNLNFSGSVTDAVVKAGWGAEVKVPGAITGSVTGKRYVLTHGARIITGGKGETAIPGTEAGTKDASSTYI